MRYRDYFTVAFPVLVLVLVLWSGVFGRFGFSAATEEINRDDTKRVNTVLLDDEDWVEFHISPNAQSIRMMTNAALTSTELPQKNQSDPRDGWRYSLQYQLLDGDGELIREQVYETRSRLRQLIDADNGALIDPLVFGRTGQVATQTRFIQIPINPSGSQPAIVRLRSRGSDPEVSEIVVRVHTKHQRPDFDKPATWRQISLKSRRKMAKFCVFDQKFLTQSERASLLRWYWLQAPNLNNVSFRFLYFIGEVDDQEATEHIASGVDTVTPSHKTTLPMPETQGELQLRFSRADLTNVKPIYITTRFFPSDQSETVTWEEKLGEQQQFKEIKLPVRGGLVELESTHDANWTATWKHDQPDHGPIEVEDQEVAFGQSIEMKSDYGNLRVYLADNQPITYDVSHLGNQPTPFRITCRIAFGDAFVSDEVQAIQQQNQGAFEGWNQLKQLQWAWLDDNDQLIDKGELSVTPEKSFYDQLWKSGEPHLISDLKRYYFSIPPAATKIQFQSPMTPFLINASVRPSQLPVVTRVPEDRQPFERRFKSHRKWFSVHPQDRLGLISGNRSFVISTQTRPRVDEEDAPLEPQAIQWQRFEPTGPWIGRQLLAPATIESVITPSSAKASYYEMSNHRSYTLENFGLNPAGTPVNDCRLIYINPSNQQGILQVKQDGRIVQEEKLVSSRGNIRLQLQPFTESTNVELVGPLGIRTFLNGANVIEAQRFIKRTASKLENGQLEFEYEKKTNLDEALTLLIYRKSSGEERCEVSIKISAADDNLQLQESGPAESLTSLHQIYDLKSSPHQQTALLIGTDAELDVEHRCFIRLGPDLPPGFYKIKATRTSGDQKGFVLLYQSQVVPNGTVPTGRPPAGTAPTGTEASVSSPTGTVNLFQ